jgi:hypothetical protein
MQCKVYYQAGFEIPYELPHQAPDGPAPEGWCDFYWDSVCPGDDGMLVLESQCGKTTFAPNAWASTPDGYAITPNPNNFWHAEFQGAYCALNAIAGIEFPKCRMLEVKSTLGEFATGNDYLLAREILLPVKHKFEWALKLRAHNKQVSGEILAQLRGLIADLHS